MFWLDHGLRRQSAASKRFSAFTFEADDEQIKERAHELQFENLRQSTYLKSGSFLKWSLPVRVLYEWLSFQSHASLQSLLFSGT